MNTCKGHKESISNNQPEVPEIQHDKEQDEDTIKFHLEHYSGGHNRH
jgi:hypothetical protein